MTMERKLELQQRIFRDQQIPDFPEAVTNIDWTDGCKILFADGSWAICRFSGTEPVLRIAAEGNTLQQTRNYIQIWESFLKQ
jgi:phosphomannomutase